MADRSTALWRRLCELFGADAVERKFGKVSPQTWVIAVDRLNDYELERGMRRLVYGGKSHVPTLPEFLKLCREIASDQFPDEHRSPVPESHRIERTPPLRWDMQADLHLMAHLWRMAALGKSPTSERMLTTYPLPEKADQLSKDLIRPFIDHAHNWAQEMREADADGTTPGDNGRAWFQARMVLAEQQSNQIRQHNAAHKAA